MWGCLLWFFTLSTLSSAAKVIYTGGGDEKKITFDKNPSIVDYWNDPTDFKFQEISRSQFNEFGAAGMNVGFDIVIHPKTGTWFLFHREYNFKSSETNVLQSRLCPCSHTKKS